MTAPARRELVEALRRRYAAATREAKVSILSEFTSVSGLHRKSAIRVLNAVAEPEAPLKRAGRPRLYDQAVQQGLVTLWEASDRVCGKRLKALLPVLLAALEKHGHMAVDPTVKASLLALSAATMDRLLAPTRAVASGRRKRRAPSQLHRKMPVRTFAEWGGARIGEMEMDLVAHCGPMNAGSYVSSLVMTDVVSGWTECAPVVVRSRELIVDTVERLRQALPFPLLSLDTDNGVEFVNEVLVEYCAKHGLGLTRSRPYLKNDQAWIEQKNGSVVRRMVGYAPQEIRLFQATIEQNLRLVRPDATAAELRQALDMAGALTQVEALPGAMQYRVGPSGKELSSSLRQKLSLARVYLSRAPIMLFDELGTGLDPQGVAQLEKTLAFLKGKATVIFISHQPELIQLADTLLVFDKGYLKAAGAPSALLKPRSAPVPGEAK